MISQYGLPQAECNIQTVPCACQLHSEVTLHVQEPSKMLGATRAGAGASRHCCSKAYFCSVCLCYVDFLFLFFILFCHMQSQECAHLSTLGGARRRQTSGSKAPDRSGSPRSHPRHPHPGVHALGMHASYLSSTAHSSVWPGALQPTSTCGQGSAAGCVPGLQVAGRGGCRGVSPHLS